MYKKIIGIFICMLLITTCAVSIVGSETKTTSEVTEDRDCGCNSNKFSIKGYSIMSDPIYVYDTDEDMTIQSMDDLPDYFSWKDYEGQDWTTPAKDQGNCGSCWDFAALGALESRINIQEGLADLDPDLSEQYVLSCLPKAANNYAEGCLGGNPWAAYKYIFLNTSAGNYCNGIIFESCMPYQASDDVPCEDKCEDWEKYLVPITNYGNLWLINTNETNIDKIKTKIIEGGPVAAGMNVTGDFSNWGWEHHNSTDYYPDTHEIWDNYLNHLIVIFGWKDDDTIGNGGYWICKNSWGEIWGYDGFYNIEYGSLFTGWFIAWADYNQEDYNWPPLPNVNGPYYGLTNEIISFSGDAEGENPPFTWQWDFGDGSTSTEQNPTHAYTSPGKYPVILTVTDDNGEYLTKETFAWIQETNQPPSTPIIDGPTKVKVGEYCWYNFTVNDADNSVIYAYWECWNMCFNMWDGPYPSNEKIPGYGQWKESGKFTIKMKAKDPYGAESNWAFLNVTVQKNKVFDTSLFLQRFFQRFPFFEKILKQSL